MGEGVFVVYDTREGKGRGINVGVCVGVERNGHGDAY